MDLANLIATLGLIITLFVFWLQSREQTRVQKAEFLFRLTEKYDQVCQFRAEHPELTTRAAGWTWRPPAEMDEADRRYFHYAEMTLGLFETASYCAFVGRTITPQDYERFLLPVLRQEVSDHRPVFRFFAQEGAVSKEAREGILRILAEVESRETSPTPPPAS